MSGMAGVTFGMASAVGSLNWPAATYVQLAAVLGIGGGLGYAIG